MQKNHRNKKKILLVDKKKRNEKSLLEINKKFFSAKNVFNSNLCHVQQQWRLRYFTLLL